MSKHRTPAQITADEICADEMVSSLRARGTRGERFVRAHALHDVSLTDPCPGCAAQAYYCYSCDESSTVITVAPGAHGRCGFCGGRSVSGRPIPPGRRA